MHLRRLPKDKPKITDRSAYMSLIVLIGTLYIEQSTNKNYVFWTAYNIKIIKSLPLFIRKRTLIKEAYNNYKWLCERGEGRMSKETEDFLFRDIK